jgi:hypothetical protein
MTAATIQPWTYAKDHDALKQETEVCGGCVICPRCGYVGMIDWFDDVGADVGNVFCNQCQHEFELVESPLPELKHEPRIGEGSAILHWNVQGRLFT